MHFGAAVDGGFGRPRRNAGRLLVAAIESSPTVDLSGLIRRTGDLMQRAGVVGRPPVFPGVPTLRVSGELLWTGDGEWLSLHRFDEFDLLAGVASRSKQTMGVRAENRAVSILMDVLRTPAPEGVLYGTLLALRMDRLGRTREGEAARTSVLKDWDIRRIDETGVNDPVGNPAFEVVEMMGGYQSELEVSHIVRKTTAERQSAFEAGVSKFPLRAVHAAVHVDPESGRMSWDLEMVGVLREAASLLVAGASWAVAAEAVADRIPSHTLADEDDVARAERNVERRQMGRPEVPLKYVDGRPNPLYRYETLADVTYPHLALRNMLHRQTEKQEQRDAVERYLDEDLGGVDDREMRRLLLVEGVYVRRVIDLFKSNRSVKRYRLIRFDLGPVDESGGVLSQSQFDAVWPPVDAVRYSRNGRTGYGYFKGLFEPVVPDRFMSNAGWLVPEEGVWRFRVRSDPDAGRRPSYGVQFEPHAKRAGAGYVTVGLVSQVSLHESVRDAIVAVLGSPGRLGVDVAWVVRAQDRAGDLSGLEKQLEAAREALRLALRRKSEPGQSADRVDAWELIAQEREASIGELRAELGRRRERAAHPAVVSAVWPVGTTVDLLAVLGMSRKFDKFATRAIQAAAQDVIRNGRIWVRLDGVVEWSAIFTLVNGSGETIEHPISGVVPNQAKDVWVHPGWPVEWWAAATGVGAPTFAAGAQVPSRVPHVAARLDRLADEAGLKLRTNAARAIVVCPDWDVVRLGVRLLGGEDVSGLVADRLREWLLVDDVGSRGPFDVVRASIRRAWDRALPQLRVDGAAGFGS